MDPLATLIQFLPLLVAVEDPKPRDPTRGIELPARVRQSRELERWKALVREDDEELGIHALRQGKLRQALAIAEKIDPEGALHALTLIEMGSLWSEPFELEEKRGSLPWPARPSTVRRRSSTGWRRTGIRARRGW